MKFGPQLNTLDPVHPLKGRAGNFVQPATPGCSGTMLQELRHERAVEHEVAERGIRAVERMVVP